MELDLHRCGTRAEGNNFVSVLDFFSYSSIWCWTVGHQLFYVSKKVTVNLNAVTEVENCVLWVLLMYGSLQVATQYPPPQTGSSIIMVDMLICYLLQIRNRTPQFFVTPVLTESCHH